MKYTLAILLNHLTLSSALKIQNKWDADIRSDFPWVRTAFESNIDEQIEGAV